MYRHKKTSSFAGVWIHLCSCLRCKYRNSFWIVNEKL